ncbi:MAG: RNA-directed DNA polymerase [Phycisphaerae bacterium]
MSTKKRNAPRRKAVRSILDMQAVEARRFLLKPESYCTFDLPSYFKFGPLLAKVSKLLRNKQLSTLGSGAYNCEKVNHSMLSNKDGRYAWRPFQLVHPALYVDLVHTITSPTHWLTITNRFRAFQRTQKLKCLSIPLQSPPGRKDRASQILNWWGGIEQKSIELAMDYSHVFHADITDCYAAIYTHSIAWAIHTRKKAKANRYDKRLLGNMVDKRIQDMQHGQTNGIPQGSVLMDFIAEMILGFADLKLGNRLTKALITDYQILRYRDDYRIFVNNPREGERILKALSEVLIELGLKLSAAKTVGSALVVGSSIKIDKRAWLQARQSDDNLQKYLLIIHAHGHDFPNSGSLVTALNEFHKRVIKEKHIQNAMVLISIAVDIAYGSPRTMPLCAAIISKFLATLKGNNERLDAVTKVRQKLSQLPNTCHMEIWLQRISYPFTSGPGRQQTRPYEEPLCKLVEGANIAIWNNDWIKSKQLKAALAPSTIVDSQNLKRLTSVIKPSEVQVFGPDGYWQ